MTLRRFVVARIPNSVRIRKRALQSWLRGEKELRLVSLMCEKHALAIDVGANYGIYSYFMSRHSAGVVAFEPVPECARFIRSALPGVRLVEGAASDRAGTATLWIPVEPDAISSPTLEHFNGLGASRMRSLVVQLETLDSLNLRPVGLIKIDVEGHELSVLRGALGTIERDHPTILVEAEERHRPGAVASVQDLLSSLGYRGFFLFRDRLESIEIFDCQIHQDVTVLGLASANLAYVNNFIFVHRDRGEIIEQLR